MSTTRKDAGSRIGLPNENTVSYLHSGHDILVVLTVTAPSFSGRKISQQLKQTEEFALRAHLTLAEVAEGQTTLLRCPECAHCKNSAVISEDTFNRVPMLSSLASSSGPTLMSQELVNLTTTTQESELLPATSQEDFYGDSLSLGKMDFEPSFLADNSLDIMSPASCIRDFRTAAVSAKLSNQPDSALTNDDAPSTLFSQQDIGNNFHQEMVQTDVTVSGVGHEDFNNTNTNSSASIRTDRRERLSQTEAAVHLAAREGYTAIITILLQSGAGVDSRDTKGRTPLHHCAENGHVEALEVLLDLGADPTATDDEGVSVILTAVKSRKEKVVETLVEALRDH